MKKISKVILLQIVLTCIYFIFEALIMDNPHAKKLLSLDFGSFLLSFGVCWSIFAFSTILIGLEYAVVGIIFGLTIGIFGSILFDSGLFVAMYQTGICLFLFNGLILININKIDILKEILGNYTRLSIILTVISLLFIFIGYPLRSFSKYTATNNKPETYQYKLIQFYPKETQKKLQT